MATYQSFGFVKGNMNPHLEEQQLPDAPPLKYSTIKHVKPLKNRTKEEAFVRELIQAYPNLDRNTVSALVEEHLTSDDSS